MKQVYTFFTSSLFIFLLILALSSVFRLILMQYIEFKGDESLNLFLATRPLFHHPFPPASQASSAGILNFPLINYLLFPIVIFTTYPPAVSFVIALINVITIGGFFLLFAKYHGKLTAFLASSILALSPWAILYSRKIWAQDFILPLMLPFLWSTYKILEGKKSFWILFGFTSMLLIQIHQVSGLIPILFFLACIIKKQHIAWKKLFLGIVIGFIPAIPYVWYMAQNICVSCRETTFFARFAYHDIIGFLRPLQIISIGDFHTELGDDFALFATRFPIAYLAGKLTYLVYIFLPIATIYFWVKNKTYKIFVPIAFIPVIVYFILGIQPLMHYYIALFPFLALFTAYFLSTLITRKLFAAIGIGVTILYFFGLILFDYGIFALLAQKGGFAGDYGSGFINSEKGILASIKQFKKNPDYNELAIIQPAPLDLFQGYMPVGKMIFLYTTLKKNEPEIEKRFIQTPTNPLLQREILAYYTQQQNPSWDYILSLRTKANHNNAFTFLSKKILNEYLEENYKNMYETSDFILLYPRHWHKTQIDNGVTLTDNTVAIIITRLAKSSLKSSKIIKNTLLTNNQQTNIIPCKELLQWCRITNQPVFLESHYYNFTVKIPAQNTTETKFYAQKVFREIVRSIRILR